MIRYKAVEYSVRWERDKPYLRSLMGRSAWALSNFNAHISCLGISARTVISVGDTNRLYVHSPLRVPVLLGPITKSKHRLISPLRYSTGYYNSTCSTVGYSIPTFFDNTRETKEGRWAGLWMRFEDTKARYALRFA